MMAVSGAERTKHYRKRRRHGIAMVARVEISEAILSGLIDAGRLDVRDGNGVSRVRRIDIEVAVAELLDDWVSVTEDKGDALR